MNSYKIYLTKNAEAARLISRGLREETPWIKDGGTAISVSNGAAESNEFIPELFYDQGYHFAMIEYRNGPDDSCPEYSLVIC